MARLYYRLSGEAVMSESLYLLGLVSVTSLLVAGLLGAPAGSTGRARRLRPALLRLLEWAGLTVGFYVLNLLAGAAWRW